VGYGSEVFSRIFEKKWWINEDKNFLDNIILLNRNLELLKFFEKKLFDQKNNLENLLRG